MEKETGGPAFPLSQHGTQTLGMHITGMTLRDYFAAKAMQGIVSRGVSDMKWIDTYATNAYKMADAMLKAREQ